MIQLEGRNPVYEAVKQDKILSIKVAAKYKTVHRIDEIINLAKKNSVTIDVVSADVLDRISQTGHHQGIIGFARAPSEWHLEEILARTGIEICIILLDHVQDPHNLGAILRTCEATGVDAVVIPKRGSVKITPAVHRVSMGGSIYVPVFERSIYTTIKLLHEEGIKLVAIDPSGETDYYEADLTKPVAFVLGGENRGISSAILEKCDKIVKIPMLGYLDSLNVSVSAAIVLYERIRQKYTDQ